MTQERTFHIITFGCQMNVHDSGWLSRALRARGWVEAPEDQARVFILNTCSVREKPEQKVYSLIGRLKHHVQADPRKFVAVGGCVAQQIGQGFFDRFDYVRLVFGTDQTGRAPDVLERLVQGEEERVAMLDFESGFSLDKMHLPEDGPISHLPGQAFINIMQGCDNFCAYCIVPYTRGRQKSRPTAEIVAEAEALAARGVREVTLLGQNVNSFGLDKSGDGVSFAELLHKVAAVEGIRRIRFTTSHPKDLAPEVISAFGELSNLCPSLHLPMQAGSDTVLSAMGRRYDMERYMGLVKALRQARSDIALTTDLIVGFPGETEEQFLETLKAVEEVGFESSFSFMYSDRPGTRSVKMEPKVPREESLDRLDRLQTLQQEITERVLAQQVGKRAEVLIENRSKKQQGEDTVFWRGRDAHGRVVNVPQPASRGELAGKLVEVEIIEAKKHSLMGKAVADPW